MLRAIAQLALNGLGVVLAAYLIPGIHYSGSIGYLLLTGLVFGLLNLLVKPIVTILSLPMIVLTLGLFFLVINGLMFYVAASFLSGLEVDGCLPAIMGGLVLAVFNWSIGIFVPNARGSSR